MSLNAQNFGACASGSAEGWAWGGGTGKVVSGGKAATWQGMQSFGANDRLGLELDTRAGTLVAFKNGTRLGFLVHGKSSLKRHLEEGGRVCWCVELAKAGDCATIEGHRMLAPTAIGGGSAVLANVGRDAAASVSRSRG